mgnify:CR=1 FL=1
MSHAQTTHLSQRVVSYNTKDPKSQRSHPGHGSRCNLTFDRYAVEPNEVQAPFLVIKIYETSIEMYLSYFRYDAQNHVMHNAETLSDRQAPLWVTNV